MKNEILNSTVEGLITEIQGSLNIKQKEAEEFLSLCLESEDVRKLIFSHAVLTRKLKIYFPEIIIS